MPSPMAFATLAVIQYGLSSVLAASSSPLSGISYVPTLTAVRTRSSIERREVSFAPKYSLDHHYADYESFLYGEKTRIAKTSIRYTLPTLALEEIESHIEDVECSQTTITLQFSNSYTLDQARSEWDQYSEFLAIASHFGCNNDGDRAPYLVSSVDYHKDGLVAIFSSRRLEWSEAYAEMTVDFGMSHEQYSEYTSEGFRFHDRLAKRAASSTAASPTTSLDPSGLIPSSTPTASSVDYNLQFSSTNHDIGHFSGSKIVSGVQVAGDVSLGCNNCAINGNIQLTEGNFTVSSESESELQSVKHGYFLAVVNDFTADMDLQTTVQGSFSDGFSLQFFKIPIGAFEIPGIATVGPVFTANLLGKVDLSATMNFTYGFQLKVPDKSSILLDLGSLDNSTISGFSESTITAIPFQASTASFDLSLSLALQPELSIEVALSSCFIQAGVALDLPSFDVEISQVSSVDSNCESDPTKYVFSDLIHIVPNVAINVSLFATAGVDIANISLSEGTSYNLAGTTFSLPTACLSFDVANGVFTTPTVPTTVAAGGNGVFTTPTVPTTVVAGGNGVFTTPTVPATVAAGGNGVLTTPTVPTTVAAGGNAKVNAGHGRSADNPFEKGATRARSGLWYMIGGLISTLIAMVLL